jgi:hypothetical protein
LKEIQKHKCSNCHAEGHGSYCSECGQKYIHLQRPLKELLDDVFDSFNIDRGILKTLIPFIIKPGFLTSEYLDGKRKKYMSPLRLYLLMSLIFFFLAQATSNKMDQKSSPGFLSISSDTTDQKIMLDDSTALELLKSDTIFIGERDTTGSAAGQRKADRQYRFQKALIKVITDRVVFVRSFYKSISYLLFILMPAYALILKLLYIRRKRLYIEHLIFSLNMHSFALLLFSIMVILKTTFPAVGDSFNLMLIFLPLYFSLGMKRFYIQAWFKTILKVFILTIVYGLLLFASMMVVLVLTIYFL